MPTAESSAGSHDPSNKYCPRCHTYKHPSQFNKHRGTYDDLEKYCKACASVARIASARRRREAVRILISRHSEEFDRIRREVTAREREERRAL